ncbi:MAG: sugar ABC transporter permease [Treponema sp.]|nr:sugar ABC transporter permease [Treponema sp.]
MNIYFLNLGRTLRREWSWYLFILIPIFGVIMFNFYPLVRTFLMSFENNRGTYIRLVNYEILFTDPQFILSIKNTVYMGILGILLNLPLAFIIAVMLNRIKFGQSFFKVLFLLPLIMSMVSVAYIFKFIFNAEPGGIMNYFIGLFHIPPQGWLTSPRMARESVVLMHIWRGLGYNVILFFAGLQSVPVEFYEAASIDGANEAHKIWHITLPSMKNTLTFVYITTSINLLKRFTDVYAVGRELGDPGQSLMTIILYIYRKSFSTTFSKDLGVGSAASITLFLIILCLTAINFALTERGDTGTPKKLRGRF